MAADEIHMGLGTSMFLHNPWAAVAGNADQLRSMADQLDTLAAADLLGVGPLSSLSVSFIPTDGICLGDLVTVYYSDFDIRTKLEVVQTDYNVMLDRYDSIELGAILPTLADTIASLK